MYTFTYTYTYIYVYTYMSARVRARAACTLGCRMSESPMYSTAVLSIFSQPTYRVRRHILQKALRIILLLPSVCSHTLQTVCAGTSCAAGVCV